MAVKIRVGLKSCQEVTVQSSQFIRSIHKFSLINGSLLTMREKGRITINSHADISKPQRKTYRRKLAIATINGKAILPTFVLLIHTN